MANTNNQNKKNNPLKNSGKIIDLKKINQEKRIPISNQSQTEVKISIEKDPVQDKTIFWWSAVDEQTNPQKSPIWYGAVGLFILLIIIFAIVQKNWLFLIFIILAVATYFISSLDKNQKRFFRINSEGVMIDEKKHDFTDLKTFSFFEKQGKNFIIFETNHVSEKYLFLPIKKDEEKIKQFLKKYLPEKEYQESFFDTLKDYLGF